MKTSTISLASLLAFLAIPAFCIAQQNSSSDINLISYVQPVAIVSPVSSDVSAEPYEEAIDTASLLCNIKEHIIANYDDYTLEKALKRADADGKVTYEADVTNKSYDFKLIYASDGQFISEGNYLADVVWHLLDQSMTQLSQK